MFKIEPVSEKSKQKELCLLCEATFHPEAFCYQMFDIDSGELMGMSQFEIGEEGFIFDLREAPDRNDFEAMFILGRQTMNFIDKCGAQICKASIDAGDETLIRAIGFKDVNGEFFCNMTGMFNGHCDCK